MNSLSTCSRVAVIEDLLQLAQAARAALVGIVPRDLQALGDLVGRQSRVVCQFQYLAVLVVFDLADRPVDEALLALLLELFANTVGCPLPAGRLPGGECIRIGPDFGLGVE